MNLRKMFLAMACLVALCIAIPQERAFAQTGAQEQERRQRHHELEQLLQRQLDQQQQQRQQHRQTVTWNVQVINATTFERMLYTGVRNEASELIIGTQEWVMLTAHGVSGQEEARWNIRRQLGFPADSDVRTVGGVTQRIIWGEVVSQVTGTAAALGATAVVPPTPTVIAHPIIVGEGEAEPRRRTQQFKVTNFGGKTSEFCRFCHETQPVFVVFYRA
ncbi:MAG: hypothetical protein FWB78_07945 [Treponema sp.]|nr:hypothetical protein [Treponema sp.]